jgi:hypothetical protein
MSPLTKLVCPSLNIHTFTHPYSPTDNQPVAFLSLLETWDWKFRYSTLNCKVTAKILNFFIRVDNSF